MLTGQPSSGKTTLANYISNHHNLSTYIIDGDELRDKYQNYDYSPKGRETNMLNAISEIELNQEKYDLIIISMVLPYNHIRSRITDKFKTKVFYLHTDEPRGRIEYHVENFEKPKNSIYINTNSTHTIPETVKSIIQCI